MKLSDSALEDFKKIYQLTFNENISNEDANVLGVKLLRFFHMVYRPIPKKWLIPNKKNERGGDRNDTK